MDQPSERAKGKTLPPPVETYLRETNPWWDARPRPPVPPFRRWGYYAVQRKLRAQLAPAVVLRGPRQDRQDDDSDADPRRDTRGLRSFLETTACNAPFGVLVTRDEDVQLDDPGIVPVSLRALLWMR